VIYCESNPVQEGKCCGVGLGLRSQHLHTVLETLPKVPWFEVHSCNFLGGGLNPLLLSKIREDYPLSFHGVSLNIGGSDPLNFEYLKKLKAAIERFKPAMVSDHLCFTAHESHHFHDLLPIPFNLEALQHIAERIMVIQDYIGRELIVENVSRYINYPESTMTESQFLSALCEKTGCKLIFDLSNAYLNQHNLGVDLSQAIAELPFHHVREIHLGGYTQQGSTLIDSHSEAISNEVWALYENLCQQHSDIPALIEWDKNLPDFSALLAEQHKAKEIITANQYISNYVNESYVAR